MDNYLRNVASEEMLGLNERNLLNAGALNTAKEITQQPAVWRKTFEGIEKDQDRIIHFLKKALSRPEVDILLTGAGSSSFIGSVLEGSFAKLTQRVSRAVATTDLLTHPGRYVREGMPVLLVSFARSGNSPESTAVVPLIESICDEVYHLVITCNASGQLAQGGADNDKQLILLLPPETDDQSLVMTSSFTGMLLAGILVSRIYELSKYKKDIERLAAYGEKIIHHYTDDLKNVASLDFDRIVFLGSGPLAGAAEESELKVQELTDGKVICKHDTYLGFRHGPKAVINTSTLIVYLFSNKEYVFKYERDLLNDVNSKEKGLYRVGVIESGGDELELDLLIRFSEEEKNGLDEDLLAVVSVLPAQLLGFFSCIKFHLHPDNPSTNGSITRIVEGVNIYPYLM